MPKFSQRSKDKLATCNHEFQNVANEAIKYIDFTIIYGKRGQKEQDDLYDKGLSKVKYPNSDHNSEPLSNAFDIAPYPIDWNDTKRFYFLAGIIMTIARNKRYKWYWGGDWDGDNDLNDQTFFDLGHFGRKKKYEGSS